MSLFFICFFYASEEEEVCFIKKLSAREKMFKLAPNYLHLQES